MNGYQRDMYSFSNKMYRKSNESPCHSNSFVELYQKCTTCWFLKLSYNCSILLRIILCYFWREKHSLSRSVVHYWRNQHCDFELDMAPRLLSKLNAIPHLGASWHFGWPHPIETTDWNIHLWEQFDHLKRLKKQHPKFLNNSIG